MFVNRLSTWSHLGLSSVTALAEVSYFQANILLTGLICSLSKLKWPNVNTLIGPEGIKNVHMQLNCPLMWLIYFYSKLPAFTSPPQPGGTRLASFWLKLNSDSFEYSCAYKVNPCAPVRLLFSWFGQIIHFHPRLCTYVWACKCLMCISDSGFSCERLFSPPLVFVSVRGWCLYADRHRPLLQRLAKLSDVLSCVW